MLQTFIFFIATSIIFITDLVDIQIMNIRGKGNNISDQMKWRVSIFYILVCVLWTLFYHLSK